LIENHDFFSNGDFVPPRTSIIMGEPPSFGDLSMKRALLSALTMAICSTVHADGPPIDFNRDIRPILSENCFYCHGQDPNKRQGDLRLDERKAAVDAGAIVPKDVSASELIKRINAAEANELMPPPKSNRRLSAEQKKLIERWIAEGAEYKTHWAFVPPVRPSAPKVARVDWVRNPIDLFVLAKLEAAGMSPSPEADRRTLIRRLSSDLIGLPPTSAEVEAFVHDTDPAAYEKLVERLLSSPHYGERMALPWLDAARYADSNGFQQDGDTWQWIWRDWVVRAMNADLPFDQFTIWQLAGDLLPNPTVDQKIASGFNRNHLLNGEGGAIPEEQRWVNLFDRVDTTATTWLGLTMACAQCHDHKYDPLTMRDYYGMLDAFNRVPESGVPTFFSRRIRVAPPVLELPSEENKSKFAEFERQIAAIEAEAKKIADEAFGTFRKKLDTEEAERKKLPEPVLKVFMKDADKRTPDEAKTLDAGIRKYFDDKVRPGALGKLPAKLDGLKKQLNEYKADQMPRVMIMSDAQPRETKILDRGEYLKPTVKVAFATPQFLPPLKDAPPNRLGFAKWLMAPQHPLTSRVQVNRMWQHFFGNGIVKTAEDFGVQGEYPIHMNLLDWLAVEFRERGWSMKDMTRLIVTSATYRQSSKVTAEHKSRDPENRLYARASRFRMPAMLLRDWALATSGLLDDRIGGVPVYPYQPDAVWENLAITNERDFTYPMSKGRDLYRRSLYTFWRRTVGPANIFDASNRQTCRVRASTTSTPLHALTTLNDPTWVEAARVLAQKAIRAADDLDTRLDFAYREVNGRTPSENERSVLRRAFDKQLTIYRADPKTALASLSVGAAPRDESLEPSHLAAMSAVCLAILNLDEALTRE
jgi:hypothetical protein